MRDTSQRIVGGATDNVCDTQYRGSVSRDTDNVCGSVGRDTQYRGSVGREIDNVLCFSVGEMSEENERDAGFCSGEDLEDPL